MNFCVAKKESEFVNCVDIENNWEDENDAEALNWIELLNIEELVK